MTGAAIMGLRADAARNRQRIVDAAQVAFPESRRAETQRRRAYEALEGLIRRAQDDGFLREDFSPEDIVLVLMTHAGVVSAAGELAPAFSGRLLEYLLEAFTAPGARKLPPRSVRVRPLPCPCTHADRGG